MVGDVKSNTSSSINGNAKVRVGGANETATSKVDFLKHQSRAISERMKDTVEISDEARALSEASKALNEQKANIESQSTAITVKAPKAMDNRQGRAEIATDYNTVLEDLRKKYGEKEAMSRFEEFMKSEGFEKVSSGSIDSNGLKDTYSVNYKDRYTGSIFTNGIGDVFSANGVQMSGNRDSNLHTHSTITGAIIDGQNQYLAQTTATYSAQYSDDVNKAIDSAFNRNLDKLQGKVGYDLASQMKKYNSSGQMSAAGVSTDLAAITNDLLRKADIELGEGQHLSLSIATDENGNYTGLNAYGNLDTSRLQEVINNEVKKDPSIVQSFVQAARSVEKLDIQGLNGQYRGDSSSVEYVDMGRSFILSGDDTSAMVIADTLGVKSTGYTYQKKVSDSFDPNADSVSILVPSRSIVDRDANYQGMSDDLANKIDEALKNGSTIDSTISEEDYDKYGAEVTEKMRMKLGEYNYDPSFYVDPASVDRQMMMAAGQPEQTQQDVESKAEVTPQAEPTYSDTKKAIHKEALSALLKMFQNSQSSIFGSFDKNISNFFKN